jgi:hypothetical protein
MPKQRINPKVLPTYKSAQFKELNQEDFEEER